MKDIVLIGAGGHCKSCIDVIEQTGLYNIVGLVDTPDMIGYSVLGYEIKWSDSDIPNLAKSYKNFIVTIGHIESPKLRIKLFDILKINNVNLPVIVSPKAYVSIHSTVGRGTMVFHNAVINAGVTIGENCIINSKALIEHDAVVGDNCHISTGAIVNGGVKIEDNVFFGSGSVAKEYVTICKDSVIGGSSLVRKDISISGVYAGLPVIKIK